MNAVIDGIYRQGKIELLQTPEGVADGPVKVILIAENATKPTRYLAFGKYSNDDSTLEDFKEAEWRDEMILDEPNGK